MTGGGWEQQHLPDNSWGPRFEARGLESFKDREGSQVYDFALSELYRGTEKVPQCFLGKKYRLTPGSSVVKILSLSIGG